MPEESVQIASAMHNAENPEIGDLDAVHDHIFAYGEASGVGAKLSIAITTQVWEAREEMAVFHDRIDQAICNRDARTLFRDIGPDMVQIIFRFD